MPAPLEGTAINDTISPLFESPRQRSFPSFLRQNVLYVAKITDTSDILDTSDTLEKALNFSSAFLHSSMKSDMMSNIYWTITQPNKIFTKGRGLKMLAEAHRKAAEDIEKTISLLQPAPYAARVVIESAWGAAFHWIAFGCQTKHQRHQESHARLATFLRSQGEKAVGEWWENLEHIRQGGWYGKNTDPDFVQHALDVLEKIRSWALQ